MEQPEPRLYRRRRLGWRFGMGAAIVTVLVVGAIWFQRTIYAPLRTITDQAVALPTARASPTSVVSTLTQSSKAAATPASPTATPLPTLSGSQRLNVLLLGSDTDAKFSGDYITQIMIVATIDPVHHTIGLLSIPRDFWVPIPGHGSDKMQIAYLYGEEESANGGGIAAARQTIEDDFGIHIDYYAWVGLEGFIKVIDTAGGVNVDALHPILDDAYPDDIQNGKVSTTNIYAYRRLYIPAGPQHMDGATALEYVRSRHADQIGDLGRSQRQQQVLRALRSKVQQPGTIFQIPAYLNDLSGYVKSDFSVPELFAFANFARQYSGNAITQEVLMPPTYSSLSTITQGDTVQDIVQPNWPAVHGLIAHMFAPPGDTAVPTSAQAGTARIAVENGTTIGGLAGQAVSYLESLGYTVDPAVDAAHSGYTQTTITVYNPAKQRVAEMIALLFDGVVQSAPSGATHGLDDIVVTLGEAHGTFEGI